GKRQGGRFAKMACGNTRRGRQNVRMHWRGRGAAEGGIEIARAGAHFAMLDVITIGSPAGVRKLCFMRAAPAFLQRWMEFQSTMSRNLLRPSGSSSSAGTK